MSFDAMSAVLHKALLGFFTDFITKATTASLFEVQPDQRVFKSNLGEKNKHEHWTIRALFRTLHSIVLTKKLQLQLELQLFCIKCNTRVQVVLHLMQGIVCFVY
jgi:hypothetical protein